jgi:hypothetical protein
MLPKKVTGPTKVYRPGAQLKSTAAAKTRNSLTKLLKDRSYKVFAEAGTKGASAAHQLQNN